MKPTKKPAAPKHLKAQGRAFWRAVVAVYVIPPHDLPLLSGACEMLDAADAARLQVETDGAVVEDRFKQKREHPAAAQQRQAIDQFRRLYRELNLGEPPADSRPPLPKGYA